MLGSAASTRSNSALQLHIKSLEVDYGRTQNSSKKSPS
ncbi:hypothetical protein TERTU_0861 [Teredinibacter turnerae T7901]|uniref:Uncharacterized protein n=1 Tax=Teredinibacter turnerae (strain ATCC 39867 / T7901) TaxID=377629 RepID=C5BPP2_TERTT|nr:hypothetical protein TERTU_0861 [Teredinibacter turnerae T7901]